jgi:hypothetical protein
MAGTLLGKELLSFSGRTLLHVASHSDRTDVENRSSTQNKKYFQPLHDDSSLLGSEFGSWTCLSVGNGVDRITFKKGGHVNEL